MTYREKAVKVINIEIKRGPSGMLFATSDDLEGLLVAARTRDDLMAEIPACIKAMFAAKGIDVEVLPVDSDTEVPPWAAIPAHVAHCCAAE